MGSLATNPFLSANILGLLSASDYTQNDTTNTHYYQPLYFRGFCEKKFQFFSRFLTDGVVDISDLVIVGRHFGEEYGEVMAAPQNVSGEATTVWLELSDFSDDFVSVDIKVKETKELQGFQWNRLTKRLNGRRRTENGIIGRGME